MPRTSRTARATRGAPAVRSLAPSLLVLPLLVGAFLAALCLLGTASAHADPLTGALDPVASAVLDPVASGSGSSGALGEAAEPVTDTLDTVHQRFGEGTADTAADLSDLPGSALPVDRVGTEVSDGARKVVLELRPTRQDTADSILAPVAEAVSGLSVSPAGERSPSETGPRADRHHPEPAADSHGHAPSNSADSPGDADEGLGDRDDGGTWISGLGSHTEPAATAEKHEPAPADADADGRDRDTTATGPAGRLSTGSTAPTGGSAPTPAVAGYLTAAPATAPAGDAVLLASHALRPVPGGSSDDPTVSPD